jgi:hypothetical protein
MPRQTIRTATVWPSQGMPNHRMGESMLREIRHAARAGLAATAVGVGFLLLAAGDAPAKGAPPATFAMTLSGTERTTWTVDYASEGLGRCRGQGSEQVSFATDRHEKLAVGVLRHGGLWAQYYFPFRYWGFPVTADVRRSATWSDSSGCQGGPSPEDAVNCDRHTSVPWALQFLLTPIGHGPDRNRVFLAQSRYRVAPDNSYGEDFDPFPGCWLPERQFPALPFEDPNTRASFGAPLSTDQVLHSKRRRFHTGVHGSSRNQLGEGIVSTTEVDWSMDLVRMKEKGGGKR